MTFRFTSGFKFYFGFQVYFSEYEFLRTVHLASIDHPQIEGKFTASPGGLLTNLFYGCKDYFNDGTSPSNSFQS